MSKDWDLRVSKKEIWEELRNYVRIITEPGDFFKSQDKLTIKGSLIFLLLNTLFAYFLIVLRYLLGYYLYGDLPYGWDYFEGIQRIIAVIVYLIVTFNTYLITSLVLTCIFWLISKFFDYFIKQIKFWALWKIIVYGLAPLVIQTFIVSINYLTINNKLIDYFGYLAFVYILVLIIIGINNSKPNK